MATLGEQEWKDHAQLVGAVALAWNNNVHQLLRVFTHLTGVEAPIADAIFFSFQSDSAQRHLIKRVAKAVELPEANRDELDALLHRLQRVSSSRNLAVHTIFGISAFDPVTSVWGPKVVPALAEPQDNRLRKDFVQQFKEAERDLAAIYHDLGEWLLHTPLSPSAVGRPGIAARGRSCGFGSSADMAVG